MPHRLSPIHLFLAIALGLGLTSASLLGDEERDESRLVNDCGVNSLYLLLRLRSAEVELSNLRRILPHTEAHGLSMAEIQEASARYGVPLRGKRIGPDDVPIDRPTIVLLKSGANSGHFVVLEPVGVSGKKVMILDFPRPAQIVDYADLIAGDAWTGLALAPITPWERFGPWVMSGSGVGLAIVGLIYPRRRRR